LILIFGGAYQGKLAYALERFGLADGDVYRCREDDATVPGNRKIIYELDKWILALVRADADAVTDATAADAADAVTDTDSDTAADADADAATDTDSDTEATADPAGAVRRFIGQNGDTVVICNDISCGVVPEDPVLRKWREAAGRAMAELAGASEEVVRLFCGIATTLKPVRNG